MSQSGQSGEAHSADKQKMKEQLKALGFWEEGMNLEIMKSTLDVINESAAMAKQPVQDIIENKPPETPPPTQISYARVARSNSPMSSKGKSLSPELIQHNKSISQEKQLESPEEKFSPGNKNTLNKGAKGGQMPNMNKGRSGNWDHSFEGMNENKRMNHRQNSQLRHEDKIPKFKINPLDFSANQHDVPLVPHYRKFHNQDCNEGDGLGTITTENVDKAIAQLSNHLRCIAEIWHSQQRSSVETEFEWGSAIKVGETNGSLDRKYNADDETKTIENGDQSIETNVDVSNESTHRRRTCTTNRPANFDYCSEINNSDDDFEIGPKRKKIASKKFSTTRSTRVKSVEPIERSESTENSVSIEKSPKVTAMCIDISHGAAGSNDETSHEPPKKVLKSKSEGTAGSVYPRRIVPPNPHRRWAGITSRRPLHGDQTSQSQVTRRKEDDNSDVEISRRIERSKSNLGLRDAEIAEELEKGDTDVIDDDDDVEGTSGNVEISSEIRPLRFSSRMKLGIQRLTQSQEEEKRAEEIRREHERIKEELISRKKQERVAKRVREEAEKLKREEEMRIEKSKREKQWRAFSVLKSKGRPVARTELFPDGLPQNSEATSTIEENHFETEYQNEAEIIRDNGRGRESEIIRVSCPICNKAFTTDEIEAHAAACEEFEAPSSSGGSRSNSPAVSVMMINSSKRRNATKLDCQVCSNFTTIDGKQYEDHVTRCVERHRERQNYPLDTIVEVPSSPIRTVRPISEQTNSEIDYKGQFILKTKSNKNIGRKRKR